MARKNNHNLQAILAACFVNVSLILACCCLDICNASKANLKGMFVFGTSVVDNGNNNHINFTLSKANYLPYGIDFPFGPTGRFSNGKNVADLMAELLGLPMIPAFADRRTKGRNILHGVNYGSGGAGILDDTGSITRLYNAGARKFALLTVYPIGCTPVVKQASNAQQCVQTVNRAASYFNVEMMNMVDTFKQKLPNSKFVVVNTYKIIRDIIKNPVARGFRNVTGPCCELKEIMGVGMSCKVGGKVCRSRNSYVYFDGQHNTEAVNSIIAERAFFSDLKTEAYPFNLQKLALL